MEDIYRRGFDAAIAQPAVVPKTCHWSDDEDGTYHTECGNLFAFTDGGPKDNDAKFCCYCGGTLDSDPL